MRATVRIAATRADVLRCQYLIAEVYNHEYGVVFSDDHYDLDAKIEPWPHKYLLVEVDGEPAATTGLYVRDTYVEKFGKVPEGLIEGLLAEAGAARYSPQRRREITKVSVARAFRGRGLARFLLGSSMSRDFLQAGTDPSEPALLVGCSKLSLWESLWHYIGLRTRKLAPFPIYKVHEKYASPADPMDSRLLIPDLDIPERWYTRKLPGEYEVES